MQVHIFRGPGRVFGFTANDAGENLPTQDRPWAWFKTLEMTRGEAQRGVNVDECLDDIDEFGFHLTDAHIRIPHLVTAKMPGRERALVLGAAGL